MKSNMDENYQLSNGKRMNIQQRSSKTEIERKMKREKQLFVCVYFGFNLMREKKKHSLEFQMNCQYH